MVVITVQMQPIAFHVILAIFSATIYAYKNVLQLCLIIMEVHALVDVLMELS